MNSASRLKEVRVFNKLTQTVFAEKLETKQAYIQRYESGTTIPDTFLCKLAEVFGVNINWLLTGVGSMNNDAPVQYNGDLIPILSYVGAGAAYANDIPHDESKQLPRMPGIPDGCIGVIVEGDSMEPVVHSGDILIVQEIKPFEPIYAGLDYVVITEKGPLVKTIYYIDEENDDKRFRLVSYNRSCRDIYPEIIYRVFRIKLHLKKYNVPEYLDKCRRKVAAELKDIPGFYKRSEK